MRILCTVLAVAIIALTVTAVSIEQPVCAPMLVTSFHLILLLLLANVEV